MPFEAPHRRSSTPCLKYPPDERESCIDNQQCPHDLLLHSTPSAWTTTWTCSFARFRRGECLRVLSPFSTLHTSHDMRPVRFVFHFPRPSGGDTPRDLVSVGTSTCLLCLVRVSESCRGPSFTFSFSSYTRGCVRTHPQFNHSSCHRYSLKAQRSRSFACRD